LKVGIDIPSPEEIRAFVGALHGRWRPLLLTAVFTGLRASELRGLRWSDVDLDRRELHVRQRADCYCAIGRPKSEAGERTVPFLNIVANTLREWKVACPPGDLVFPTRRGTIERLPNIIARGLHPAWIKAGVVTPEGKAKYTGMHSLRHFYAGWCINRRADGGMELPLKTVQDRLGHSTLAMTADTYGHLSRAVMIAKRWRKRGAGCWGRRTRHGYDMAAQSPLKTTHNFGFSFGHGFGRCERKVVRPCSTKQHRLESLRLKAGTWSRKAAGQPPRNKIQ
jgi:integrase